MNILHSYNPLQSTILDRCLTTVYIYIYYILHSLYDVLLPYDYTVATRNMDRQEQSYERWNSDADHVERSRMDLELICSLDVLDVCLDSTRFQLII